MSKTLTPEEEYELEVLFANNEEAVNEYRKLINTIPEDELNSYISDLKTPGFWRDIPEEIRQEASALKRKYIKIGTIAATVVGIIIISIISYNKQLPSVITTTSNNLEKVQLTLADGKTIDLSSDTGTIVHNGLTINNSDHSLAYENTGKATGINSVEVPKGMDYKIKLSDGSIIWMNSDTKLSFPSKFADNKREITINGEAYLEISKNPSKPFFVTLPNSIIEVLGTEFNVNTYDQSLTKVSLMEGGVKMSADNMNITLSPGNQGVYSIKQKSLRQEPFNAEKTLSWRKGLFYFNKVSLSEICTVINRWYGIKTIIDNSALETKKFVGLLDKNKSIDYFLDNLKNISKLDTYYDKEGILHFKQP